MQEGFYVGRKSFYLNTKDLKYSYGKKPSCGLLIKENLLKVAETMRATEYLLQNGLRFKA